MQADNKTVNVDLKPDKTAARRGLDVNNAADGFAFTFDNVLKDINQEGVYDHCASEVVDNVMNGYNGTVFAYGQTGAGKTFTMTGEPGDYKQRGVVPRAVHHIFHEMDMRVEKEKVVRVSYLEIYNEQMYDLLADSSEDGGIPSRRESLTIVERGDEVRVKGLTKKYVASEAEALAAFFAGDANRAVAAHALNKSSSRSHCVFTIHLEQRATGDGPDKTIVSKLHLVDLAGSERVKKSHVTGALFKEATFINRSLSLLEQTVMAMSRKDKAIPYRQSKLTSVLRDSLIGNCKTVMIACVWPEFGHVEETVSTCRFSGRVRTLRTNPVINESKDPRVLLRKYERQVQELKQELAMRDTFANRETVNYGDLSEIERTELSEKVRDYVHGMTTLEELPCDSLKRVRETFKLFKAFHLQMREEHAAEMAARPSPPAEDDAAVSSEETTAEAQNAEEAPSAAEGEEDGAAAAEGDGDGDEVGDVDDGDGGFHLGVAPDDAAPPADPDSDRPRSANAQLAGALGGTGVRPPILAPEMSVHSKKNSAFAIYKKMIAPERAAELRDKVETLRVKRVELNAAVEVVNAAKASIDELSVVVEEMRSAAAADEKLSAKASTLRLDAEAEASASGSGAAAATPSREGSPGGSVAGAGAGADPSATSMLADEVIDEETYAAMARLKATKGEYRRAYDEVKDLKTAVAPHVTAVQECRAELLREFQRWYDDGGHGQIGGVGASEEELDYGEQFVSMELQKIASEDPESVAFFAAKKTMRQAPRSVPLSLTRSRGR